MFYSLTKEQKQVINDIYQYFLSKFPEIDKEVLYDRIFSGFCWGEGQLPIISIEDWNSVFYNGKWKGLLTVFDDWNDYLKYKGDWHKKVDTNSSKDNTKRNKGK